MLGAIVLLCWLLSPSSKAKLAAEETRRGLREAGFKLDLSEFDLSSSAEERSRADAIIAGGRASAGLLPRRELDLARPIATNAAVVLHRQQKLITDYSEDFWPTLEAGLERISAKLDAACAAARSGRIRFEPIQSSTGELTVTHLVEVRSLASALAARTTFELHRSNHAATFSNLLALTRLTTAWDVEPIEASHYMRFFLANMAQKTLWEALQAQGWSDAELEELQREWEAPDFFKELPDTAASTRASLLALCRYEASQPPMQMAPIRQIASEMFTSPSRAWEDLRSAGRDSRYRKYGVYEEEKALLIFLRDRELELKRAVTAAAWAQMRSLPGITNFSSFGGAARSPVATRLNARPTGFGLFRQGYGLARRAAEIETVRRLAVTALALERLRLRTSSYPQSLASLFPDYLREIPIDFMDGNSLRYRPISDQTYVLYSTGADCVDDGGRMMRTSGPDFGRREGPDSLWPRAASEEEAEADLQARLARLRLAAREGFSSPGAR